MRTNILNKIRKLRPAHLLAFLFLAYTFRLSLAAAPEFLYHLGRELYWKTGYSHLIETVDEQYGGMLTTEKEQPLLQNKGTYINLNGQMANILGQPMMNDRVTLKNGHLASLVPDSPDPEEIREAADNILGFYNTHAAGNGKFLFVMVPSQISKYEDLLPVGYTDTTNASADTFLAYLKEGGVPYLDLREEMQEDGLSVTDAYFQTDHHWTPQTGFWAYGKILKKLAEIHAIEPVDPFCTDPDNYTFETYPDTFLGSSGKRTGIFYAGLDDSIYIRPDFETDITVSVPERNLEKRGRFEDVAYNTEAVHNFEDPDFFQENVYGLYGWGDTAITHWRNAQAPDQSRFLLMGESFGNIPFSLMSIPLGCCDEIDLRYFEEDDFPEYYTSYDPDTVVLLFNVDNVISEFTDFDYLK